MAYTMTYNTLIEDLQRYLERGEDAVTDPMVYNQFPRMITLAERRITKELKLQGLQQTVTTVMTAGSPILAKPSDWRLTVSINIGTGQLVNTRKVIQPRAYEYIRTYWPDDTSVGTPDYYADYGAKHWVFAPTPSLAFPMEINYFAQPVELGAENQENYFTENTPDLLLYAALLESAPFLKDDGRLQIWQSMYERAAKGYSVQDMSKIDDRTITRDSA